jgi:hypothetical protein
MSFWLLIAIFMSQTIHAEEEDPCSDISTGEYMCEDEMTVDYPMPISLTETCLSYTSLFIRSENQMKHQISFLKKESEELDYKKKSLLRGVSSEDQIKKYNSDAQKHNEGIYWILGVARKLEEKREEYLKLNCDGPINQEASQSNIDYLATKMYHEIWK